MYLIKVTPMQRHIGGGHTKYAIISDPMRAIARFNQLRIALTNEAPVHLIGCNMDCGGIGNDYRIELIEYTLQECAELQRQTVHFYEWSETVIF